MNLFQILADTLDLCKSAAGYKLFGFVGHILRILQISIPVIIILMGTIDLVKAVVASKTDEMKKAQSILIKRLIYGVIIFFVPIIAKFLVNLVGGDTTSPCLNCVLYNPEGCVETGNNKDKNSSNNVNNSNNNNINSLEGGIPTQEMQTDNVSKTICNKCEEQGKKCIEHVGKYLCDDGSTHN